MRRKRKLLRHAPMPAEHGAGSVELGACIEPGGVRFSAWSDRGLDVTVVIYERPGVPRDEIALEPTQPHGTFTKLVSGLGEGTLYDLKIGGETAVDPYARSLPFGVNGPAAAVTALPPLIQPKHRVELTAGEVLYEIHVGTFTPEGTFTSAIGRLEALKELGVTVIELMPIAAFAGARGWGYDGVGLFTPLAAYGDIASLRAFIERAHELGLGVILDAVYNHLGPAGNYLPRFSDNYFDHSRKNAWGEAPALKKPAFRRLVLESAHYWLSVVGFDGLRLDATHELEPGGDPHILRALANVAHACTPPAVLIAEDNRNDPSLLFAHGIDGVWSDDFHHAVHVLLTQESDGYYGAYNGDLADLARVCERGQLYEGQPDRNGNIRGAPVPEAQHARFVFALQNHDQVGNRAYGERLHELSGIAQFRAASLLLLFLPATPLLFMGEEWAASSPFLYFTDHDEPLGRAVSEGRRSEFSHFASFRDTGPLAIPNPQLLTTFERSKLNWLERERGEHARSLALYRAALDLRRNDRVLREPTQLSVWTSNGALFARRVNTHGERLLVLNIGDAQAFSELDGRGALDVQLLLSTHPELASTHGFELPANSATIYALAARQERS